MSSRGPLAPPEAARTRWRPPRRSPDRAADRGGDEPGRAQRALARADRPVVVAAVAGTAVLVFACARLALVGDGDITTFIVAGADFTDPATTGDVRVVGGTGYDGQFAYRLALDPLDLEGDRNGIEVDSALRWGRIAYPALAWLAAGGQAEAVPAALVAVNVAAAAVVAWLAALAARHSRVHAAWGLLVAGWAGFVFTIARDLTEVVAAVGVVGGLVAWQQRRPGWAATALTVAVLAREGTLVVVAALAVVRLAAWVRGRERPSTADVAWVVPVVAFGAWQAWCRLATGTVPVLTSLEDHVADPFVGAGADDGWLGEAAGHLAALKLAQLAVLMGSLVLAVLAARRGRVDPTVVVALGLAVAVALRVWGPVWNDWAGFRGFTDVYVLAAIAALAGRRHLGWLALAVVPVWVATAGHMAVTV